MRPTERHSFHFDFSHLDPHCDYTFHHGGTSIHLQRHSSPTLTDARSCIPMLGAIPDVRLTHFVEADIPSDAIALLYVTKRKTIDAQTFDHPVHMAIHIPRGGREAVRQRSIAARGGAPATLHPKLARLGVTLESLAAAAGDDVDPQFPAHIHSFQDATDAAVALLFHHTNLINLNASNGGTVPGTIVQHITDAVASTGELPLEICSEGDSWLLTTPLPGPPATSSITPSPKVMNEVTGPLQHALLSTQNDATLQGQQWNFKFGIASAPYGGAVTGVSGSGAPAQRAPDAVGEVMRAKAGSGGDSFVPRNLTATNGLSVDPSSVVFTPPPSSPTWTAQGTWSLNDGAPFSPLTAELVAAIKAGNVFLQISTKSAPQGLIRGQLIVGSEDPATGLIPLSATLSGSQVVPSVSTTATGTATFTLNTGGTGLTYTISISLADSADVPTAAFVVGAVGTKGADAAREVPLTDGTSTGTLAFECTNTYLRHLSACVQYLDVGGNVLQPQGWSDRIPAFLRDVFEPDSTKKFVQLIPPVITVFGVPIPASATQISIPVWEEVHTVRLLFGGLGRGPYDSAVCPIGITVTALAELALPVFLLVAGAAVMNSKPVVALMADTEVLMGVCVAGTFLAAGAGAAAIGTAQDPAGAAKMLAAKFGPMLLSPATSLGRWVAGKFSEGAAERAVPFVDIALAVINGAVTAAQLTETIVEVLESPFVYEVDLSRAIDLQITLEPDPSFNKFPDHHDHYRVVVMYDVATTSPSTGNIDLPATTLSDPIPVSFTSVPAGGNLRVYAFFYAADGWQSGQGVSPWIPAISANGPIEIKLIITTNQIPLGTQSVYVHQQKMGLVSGQIGWMAAVGIPPVATLLTPPPLGKNEQVLVLGGITVAQEPEMIGYSWQATGLEVPPDDPKAPPSKDALWTVQTLSVLQEPYKGFAVPDVGFTLEPGIAFNIASADGSPLNFFIDASNPIFDAESNPSGGYHVRSVSLAHAGPAPSLTTHTNSSYGRFPGPVPIDRYAYHPQGYLFGISLAASKLYRLQLATSPVDDAAAPMATMCSGQGKRDGLMKDPVGLAVGFDGRILVLEKTNQRVQAFDIYGNAVRFFKDPHGTGSSPTIPTMTLVPRSNSTYLDISVESQGFIYVLSFTGDGSAPSMYFVDLYRADGTFLVTTPDVAAAKMVVDVLRNLYTLNYEVFVDATGRQQPSVSMWLPPAPPPNLETSS